MKEKSIFVRVERNKLLSALERAFLIAEERIQGSGRSYVKLIVEGDKMNVTSASVNGKVFDDMPVTHEGEDIEIGFNCRYLINTVRATEGDELILAFKSATRCVTVTPGEEDEKRRFFYMVLPVRMNQA